MFGNGIRWSFGLTSKAAGQRLFQRLPWTQAPLLSGEIRRRLVDRAASRTRDRGDHIGDARRVRITLEFCKCRRFRGPRFGPTSPSRLMRLSARTHERVEVTRQGRRAAVILSADDFDSIMETLAILSDQELMREVRAAEAEAEDGQIYTLDEVTEETRAVGRLPH